MPDNNFYVDTDGIARYEPFVREVGAHLRAVHEALQARLADLGPCWGDDATGHQFLAQYQPGARAIREAVVGASQLFDSTSDGIGTMAVQFDRLETENIDAVGRKITNAPGGTGAPGHGSGAGHGTRA